MVLDVGTLKIIVIQGYEIGTVDGCFTGFGQYETQRQRDIWNTK